MSANPIFVATHPRACSTAFERVFMTRRDTLQTIHEPFGDAYYYGPERMGRRFEEDEEARQKSGFANSTYRTILDRIEKESSEGKRVLIKDMAQYLVPPFNQQAHLAPSLLKVKRGVGTEEELNSKGGLGLKTVPSARDSAVSISDASNVTATKKPPFPYDTPSEPGNPTVMPKEILERFHFTFLIRHPSHSIPSYYRCCIEPLLERTGFAPFMPEEAGYRELRQMFDFLKSNGFVGPRVCSNDIKAEGPESGLEICLIDADDLLDDPEGIMRRYCQSVGIDFEPEMLIWDDEKAHEFARSQFSKWDGFHDDAINSKDLKPRQHKHSKSQEQMYSEWVEKYGQEAADMIQRTVDENVADYEYLKQFAIKASES
ncbi:hypothetical protein EJ03DRAFT_355907 [Teratosphaeria nubilosa]|uniref:P-loop containing nucleoside triphosphate hydrolase protein n=1 Tax=Teratosphaeria nubilosa TaxID=161662 RepID=A0A6G1KVW5_9PEZI|nr:hypothetical protein EJ03DRAFT_355907 [Teratosphaeria nubilosa]